ncbi:MAG: hypothetical protein JW891_00090 [Candidatus Lokiarchaeota archaeon]|nr:hypothetical protein [Candidatus Lokiarchaeota archaeon]
MVPKEGIPLSVIDKAIIKNISKEKRCLIEAQGRQFSASVQYRSVRPSIETRTRIKLNYLKFLFQF